MNKKIKVIPVEVGMIFPTNTSGDLRILATPDSMSVLCEFVECGKRVTASKSNIRAGKVSNRKITTCVSRQEFEAVPCLDCGDNNSDNFSEAKGRPGGRQTYCKPCSIKKQRAIEQSLEGRLKRSYKSQKTEAKKQGVSDLEYSYDEFREWAKIQGFEILYEHWRTRGFSSEYAPSVDRIDQTEPFALNNLQLVVWEYNRQKKKMNDAEIYRLTELSTNYVTYVNGLREVVGKIGGFRKQLMSALSEGDSYKGYLVELVTHTLLYNQGGNPLIVRHHIEDKTKEVYSNVLQLSTLLKLPVSDIWKAVESKEPYKGFLYYALKH